MDRLLILGAGQYSRIVREIAEESARFERIDFLDDRGGDGTVGVLADYSRLAGTYTHATVALGNSELRLRLLGELEVCGYCIASIISARACVSREATLDVGCIVEPMAVIQTGCKLGRGCLVSAGAILRHHAVLGDGCHADCNSVIDTDAIISPGLHIPCGTFYQGNGD
ncbi:MAG: PglB [Clostridia bacterium]|nr:PglB [Clostridia bacterium]